MLVISSGINQRIQTKIEHTMQRKGSVEQDTYGTSANKGEHTTRTREVRNDKTALN